MDDDDLFAGIFDCKPLSIGVGTETLDKQIADWEENNVPLPATPPLPVHSDSAQRPSSQTEAPVPPPPTPSPSPRARRQSRSRSMRRVRQQVLDPDIELAVLET